MLTVGTDIADDRIRTELLRKVIDSLTEEIPYCYMGECWCGENKFYQYRAISAGRWPITSARSNAREKIALSESAERKAAVEKFIRIGAISAGRWPITSAHSSVRSKNSPVGIRGKRKPAAEKSHPYRRDFCREAAPGLTCPERDCFLIVGLSCAKKVHQNVPFPGDTLMLPVGELPGTVPTI